MRALDEYIPATTDNAYPFQPVAPVRDNAAQLRRVGYGPIGARYLAIHLMLEDIVVQMHHTASLIPEGDGDGVLERHATELTMVAQQRVTDTMVRHIGIEARRAILGRPRRKVACVEVGAT